MTGSTMSRASVIAAVALLALSVTLSGCGRFADRADSTSTSSSDSGTESGSESTAGTDAGSRSLDDVDALLDEAGSSLATAEQDAAEGQRAEQVGDEP
jgi:hypothetical protein